MKSILDIKATEVFDNFPKGFWTEHFNTISLYDSNVIEFEDLPDEYKDKPNLYKIERESEIKEAKREIYNAYVEEFKMSAKNVGINDFWEHWSSIVEENMIREVNNEQKD